MSWLSRLLGEMPEETKWKSPKHYSAGVSDKMKIFRAGEEFSCLEERIRALNPKDAYNAPPVRDAEGNPLSGHMREAPAISLIGKLRSVQNTDEDMKAYLGKGAADAPGITQRRTVKISEKRFLAYLIAAIMAMVFFPVFLIVLMMMSVGGNAVGAIIFLVFTVMAVTGIAFRRMREKGLTNSRK